jgi:hypothetical protein
MALMEYIYDDGGRSLYFKGKTGDCVCRSIAIASGRDYKEIYDLIFYTMKESPRNGVNTRTAKFKRMMESLGFRWVATSGIGSHQAVHLVKGELPEGRLVCSMAGHYTAVVNNHVRDIIDPRTNDFGDYRKVYGYWKIKED